MENFSEGELLPADAKKTVVQGFHQIYQILDPAVFGDIFIVSMCLHLKK